MNSKHQENGALTGPLIFTLRATNFVAILRFVEVPGKFQLRQDFLAARAGNNVTFDRPHFIDGEQAVVIRSQRFGVQISCRLPAQVPLQGFFEQTIAIFSRHTLLSG